MGESIFAAFPLPESGEVIVGRAPGADIFINHASISRQHCVLRMGSAMEVEDLGSVNGTKVNETRLEPGRPARVGPGDLIHLSGVTLVIQRHAASAGRQPQKVWTHGYFEARLEDECERARRSGSSFLVARLRCESPAAEEIAERALGERLRSLDIQAAYGPRELEVLLPDTPRSVGEQLLTGIAEHCRRQGAPIALGMASYPQDGRDPESLVAELSAAVRGGPEAAAHEKAIVACPAMQRIYQMAERAAGSTIGVLLLGETGAGKEILADWIHGRSQRAGRPFLRLNCAALPENLLESELFGYEKGAFTGAVRAKPGLIEAAEGGTVFLDEVAEMPLSVQAKLLRAIEARQVSRLGSVRTLDVDVRFIAATNRDLDRETQRGTFREDLFYRLNGFAIAVPPLRERVEEIEPLARHFILQACKQAGLAAVPTLSAETKRCLLAYRWPGNLRELRNTMERAVLLCAGGAITLDHLPLEKMTAKVAAAAPPAAGAEMRTDPRAAPAPEAAGPPAAEGPDRQAERERVIEALAKCGGNQTRAAKLLGISRRTLTTRLNALGLPRPRKRSGGP